VVSLFKNNTAVQEKERVILPGSEAKDVLHIVKGLNYTK
jgi:hypothetical protein